MPDSEISNKDIFDLIKSFREEVKQEIILLKENFSQEIQLLQDDNRKLREKNQELEKRLLAAERKNKKYNLICYGLSEHDDGISDIQQVLDLFNRQLEVKCRYEDFRDIHRIGKNSNNKVRPVAIEVVNYGLKTEIIKNAKKLRGTIIQVSNDFIPEDYNNRKILYNNFKVAKSNGADVIIRKDTLIINKKVYTIEDLNKDPVVPHDTNENVHFNDNKEFKKRRPDPDPPMKRSNRLADRKKSTSDN